MEEARNYTDAVEELGMLISEPVVNAGLTLTEYTSAPQAPPVASVTENASNSVAPVVTNLNLPSMLDKSMVIPEFEGVAHVIQTLKSAHPFA